MADTKLYAWAWGLETKEIQPLLDKFDGKLGAVVYHKNYDILKTPGRWIAFVGSLQNAQQLVDTINAGGHVDAAIVQDERNQIGGGLSGGYWSPQQYADNYNPIYKLLKDNGIPVSTMGLVGVPGPMAYLKFNVKFDDLYYKHMMDLVDGADYNAFNPGNNRQEEIHRVLDTYTDRKWIFSPHPLNPQWWPLKWNNILAWFLENKVYHEDIPFWVETSKDDRLLGIAIWSLRYNYMNIDGKKVLQRYCNLLDLNGEYTVAGRQLKAALNS